ncbi:MAG: SH3-like domain-containing protein [Candidatus Latescibacterota bacterium]|jgi:hypothetical protein|tara:strand:+ start:267 stop:566 length:300 start_codon:yes stop_codon:yes gene_type:complete
MAEHFDCGQRVIVRKAFPPGHIRTPYFVRGCSGWIERIVGTFANPEELAYNRDGLPSSPLYRVRFKQHELWPDYRGHDTDTLSMDLYGNWLELSDEEKT